MSNTLGENVHLNVPLMLIWIFHMDYLEKSKWTQIQHNVWLTSKWIVHMADCPTRHSLNIDLDVHPAPDGPWSLYARWWEYLSSLQMVSYIPVSLEARERMLRENSSQIWIPKRHQFPVFSLYVED